jgi:hypothetical protein
MFVFTQKRQQKKLDLSWGLTALAMRERYESQREKAVKKSEKPTASPGKYAKNIVLTT